MKKFNIKKKINLIENKNIKKQKLSNSCINLIDINIKLDKTLKNITSKSNKFITKSFEIGLNILKILDTKKFINGPISKKTFLKQKYYGVTEYISHKSKIRKFAMLIYNKELSVCPLTTHIPIKNVLNISQEKIYLKKSI